MNVRVACARILAGVLKQEGSLNTLIPAFVDQVPDRDVNLLKEICFGTLRHFPALNLISATLLEKPLRKKDTDIQALILSGLYQIREMRTPEHAAVNEAVAACKSLKKPWARGLVNSSLRRYVREQGAIDSQCEKNPDFNTLHPDWLQQNLRNAWGDRAEAIMTANNTRPPMTLRVNQLQTTRNDYLAALSKKGIAADAAAFSAQGIYLETPCAVDELPGFSEGWVSIQDEAAQLSSSLLDLKPGQRVLDSCCAPGGKTCHILEHQRDLGEMVAMDVDEERVALVRQNLERLQLSATLKAADACNLDNWWDGELFDRILLDAPCSATGVIRRHPDIKILRRADDIDKLAATQASLLNALWSALKPGGKLLYATCSVLPQENDDIIRAFCEQQSACQSIAIEGNWGTNTRWGRQLFPACGGHDGFYYALLKKMHVDGEMAK